MLAIKRSMKISYPLYIVMGKMATPILKHESIDILFMSLKGNVKKAKKVKEARV